MQLLKILDHCIPSNPNLKIFKFFNPTLYIHTHSKLFTKSKVLFYTFKIFWFQNFYRIRIQSWNIKFWFQSKPLDPILKQLYKIFGDCIHSYPNLKIFKFYNSTLYNRNIQNFLQNLKSIVYFCKNVGIQNFCKMLNQSYNIQCKVKKFSKNTNIQYTYKNFELWILYNSKLCFELSKKLCLTKVRMHSNTSKAKNFQC